MSAVCSYVHQYNNIYMRMRMIIAYNIIQHIVPPHTHTTTPTHPHTGPLATEDPSGRTWQRFTDAVVQAALLALPWGGIDLWPEMPPSAHAQLHGQVQAYLDARPLQESPALGPFFQPLDEEDVLAGLDNEGASFLTTLWAALHTCQVCNFFLCCLVVVAGVYIAFVCVCVCTWTRVLFRYTP